MESTKAGLNANFASKFLYTQILRISVGYIILGSWRAYYKSRCTWEENILSFFSFSMVSPFPLGCCSLWCTCQGACQTAQDMAAEHDSSNCWLKAPHMNLSGTPSDLPLATSWNAVKLFPIAFPVSGEVPYVLSHSASQEKLAHLIKKKQKQNKKSRNTHLLFIHF